MRKLFTLFSLVISLVLTVVIGFPSVAFASTGDQFTIGLSVVADTLPPSVPAGLVASPISSSQIDLSWNASTDNVAVAGYVVYRNASPIATTSSLAYSDTALSASTLYTYNIRAFDASGNYSGLSSSASATTTAPTSSGGGGTPPDTTPPTASSFSPLNGATGVATTTSLQITMSETVNKATGNITIKRYLDGSIVETIPVSSAQISIVGTTVTIVPASPFLSKRSIRLF